MPRKKGKHHKRTKLAVEQLMLTSLLADARQPLTMPNTPTRSEVFGPVKSRAKLARLGDDKDNTLARIKSLSKIDLRSPVLYQSVSADLDDISDALHDLASLITNLTNRTHALRGRRPRENRIFYDDFTTIDWAKAYIQTNKFNYEIDNGKHIGHIDSDSVDEEEVHEKITLVRKAYFVLSKWLLIVIIAASFAVIAYFIDKFEILLVGFKYGYCRTNWFASEVSCCRPVSSASPLVGTECEAWVTWSSYFGDLFEGDVVWVDFGIYALLSLGLACVAGAVTLTTRIAARLPRTKEKLLNESSYSTSLNASNEDIRSPLLETESKDTSGRVLFTGAGSGVPEVRTILSGFVIRRFLGTYTLCAKTIALIFAIASGLCLGKEGPYVHLATCVGNILTRFFPHINNNELSKKQILSASASSGVALAFGSPLGGVLFILEEINHYLPSNQLFLIFFCAIMSTLFLKFLNPYGTGNTVLFELNYTSDWHAAELPLFVFIGIAGGVFGAAFIRFSGWWSTWFREKSFIKNHFLREVAFVSLLTGIITYWNDYTKQASAELVLDLATPCSANNQNSPLCLRDSDSLVGEIRSLCYAFVIKVILTFITFGLKLPCGIYVPSMVAGALFGRIFAMCIQFMHQELHDNTLTRLICHKDSPQCVDLGIYAMISAGAFMAGVTRMNITLVTILFELTSSYTYVLPISISIAVANWMGNLLEKNSLYEYLLIANDYPFMSPETEVVDPFVTANDLLAASEKYTLPKEGAQEDDKAVSNNVQAGPEIESTVRQLVELRDEKLFIDVSASPYVSTQVLYNKLLLLATESLLDGCVAILKDGICVGAIYFSELEFCLDRLKQFCLELDITKNLYCKMFNRSAYSKDSWAAQEQHNLFVLDEGLGNSLRMPHNNDMGNDYFNYGSNEEYIDYANDKRIIHEELTLLVNFTRYVDTSPIFINHDSSIALAHLIFDRIGNRTIILQKEGKFYGVLHKKALVDYCRRPLE